MQSIGPDDTRLRVSEAVRGVLGEEARRNEIRVGVIRVAGYGAIVVLDAVLGAAGLRPPGNTVQSAICLVISSAVLAGLLRARHHAWLRWVAPALDAGMLYAILRSRLAQLGADTGLVATTALVCALFATTGALRLNRASAVWTTSLAGLMLVALLAGRAEHWSSLVYSVAALGAIGALTLSLTALARRSMEGAGSRELLGRFLPSDLVDRAFDAPEATLAEPRVVVSTLLVSDLRGFTALAERAPPRAVFAFLSQLHGELARAVRAHGGTVDKFMGDGMLAVFGGDDHCRHALAAVRDIRAAVERLNEANYLGAPVRIGVGVHTGPIVAGVLGSGERLESTVIGDAVNIASRLEQLTKDYAVDAIASRQVVDAAGAEAEGAVRLGTVRIRGREQALEIYALGPAAADRGTRS